MKRSGKIILTVLACVVAFYGIFVAADCIRLKNAKPGEKPIITISEDKENHRYNGLGYSVEYYLNEDETSYENAYGRECRLFGKILLWAFGSEKIQGADAPTEPEWRYAPMVMVNGELYIDTGIISEEPRCGVMDGEIKSEVEGTEKPTQNDQSNFGKGYGYQFGQEGTIEILMDGNWKVFAAKEKREEIQGVDTPIEPEWCYSPMVMVNGELYFDTGIISEEPRSCIIDGEINSQVEATEKPNQNDQSNFGKGYGYQFGEEGTIEVCMDGKWKVFAMEEKR